MIHHLTLCIGRRSNRVGLWAKPGKLIDIFCVVYLSIVWQCSNLFRLVSTHLLPSSPQVGKTSPLYRLFAYQIIFYLIIAAHLPGYILVQLTTKRSIDAQRLAKISIVPIGAWFIDYRLAACQVDKLSISPIVYPYGPGYWYAQTIMGIDNWLARPWQRLPGWRMDGIDK